ncbi:hypothetical protein ACVWY2_004731 [Bradyrhizobium sp. JR6.1]
MPDFAMYFRIAAAIRSSLGTTLNAQRRRSSIGRTIAVAAASEMIGVLDSNATSSIGMVTGVSEEPIRISTPSWITRRRAFCVPLVGSDSSSRAI